MSGGGGGGGIGGGGASDGASCSALLIRTTLKSPVPATLAVLTKGDALTVAFSAPGSTAVIAKTTSGATAGAIVSGSHAQMVACMQKGFEYIALVLRVSGGACDVEVRPKA